ncbi:hypothetical protein ACHAXS_005923 [Conticribra weissflogii]
MDPPEARPSITPTPTPTPSTRPTPYLIITNISKRRNIQSLLQIAISFGCPKIFVVGQKAFDFDPDGADIPAVIKDVIRSGRVEIVRFDTLEGCVGNKQKQTIQILGVEIDNNSKNLESEPFATSVAFMMGNEGSGMTSKQMSFCDGFVRISQYGGGTASLNVSVAASIVLHRFFHWGVRGDLVRRYCCDDDVGGGDGAQRC